jgi:hypothetical protein
MLPALTHAAAKIRTAVPAYPVSSKSAKQDSAESQQPKRLPEADLAPPEKRRQQPVPQSHYQLAADQAEKYNSHDRGRSNEKPSFSHPGSFLFS